ncbi:hypothetical protein [Nocardia macrotermitis]|uniref:hypothetical protein n=1 Tax=Nocardia macrotermitis TaxID=2585198 RepID=UPI001296FB89|nr:hypothetical protein [Nocardia macrotermitis]
MQCYAGDAVVAATALRAVKPTVILTSDVDDMSKLCGKRIRIVAVWASAWAGLSRHIALPP